MAQDQPLRLAIVGSPRCGNTWLHRMLSSLLKTGVSGAHRPQDIAWSALPPRSIVQLHWRPTDEFQALLRRHEFRSVVLTRHPFDTLISILHFANHEPEVNRWLDGEGGNETELPGATPVSPRFLSYAASPRAAVLVGLSREWRDLPAVQVVRYEELVHSPVERLKRLLTDLDEPHDADRVAEVVAAHSLDRLRPTSANQHFWKGRPGLWKSFLTSKIARRLYSFHRRTFDSLQYACDPDDRLTERQAQANWAEQDRNPSVIAPAARAA